LGVDPYCSMLLHLQFESKLSPFLSGFQFATQTFKIP
jgi:hypothetical protein